MITLSSLQATIGEDLDGKSRSEAVAYWKAKISAIRTPATERISEMERSYLRGMEEIQHWIGNSTG